MDTTKKNNLDNRIDYGIILPVFMLAVIGLLSLYVALAQDVRQPDIMGDVLKQGLWYILGGVAIIILMQFSSKILWRLTPIFYALGLGLMVALLQFYDPNLAALTGSKNWFVLGPLSFQPAELMKIAYILMMAFVVTRHNLHHKPRSVRSDFLLLGKMILVSAPVIGLVLMQKDFGTMLVFLAIFAGVFLMSGITWKIELPLIVFVVVVAAGTIYLVTTDSGRELLYKVGFHSYQFDRIDSWLDPFHDTTGKSYQPAQALMAIGSGGIFGKGFNVSEVYVPVRESDMIFSVIGENFGFVGGTVVILLYFYLIYRMVLVCFATNNEFYAYISTGIIMMILFHVFENIGANIGLLPLTGIPLPFISQGGSALLSNLIGVGLLLSMRFQAEKDTGVLH
ncbi:FtsW/RodA/SpoVE family cell cycle protein [Enterococcus timonensis]|uniref:FtsW/RodA/SpoVE family cell cycle protein n=1 Tax=Enterococcus timonensis TaxID=1852364 RepID=UPI0008D92B07|nr:FtsW/RodA/SpoVE family cell cycle protein [Enterococcus timonensis]